MAVGTANLTYGSLTSAAAAATIASLTYTANRLYLTSVISRTSLGGGTNPNQPTITGAGVTWTAIGSSAYDNTSSSRKYQTMFRGMVASNATTTGTIDFGGQTQTHVGWAVDEFTNTDTTGVNGAGAVVQVISGSAPSAGTNAIAGTLAAFGSSINATYGAIADGNGTTLTKGGNFTQMVQGTASAITLMTEFNVGNIGTINATDASNSELGLIGVEIKAAAGAVSPRLLGNLMMMGIGS